MKPLITVTKWKSLSSVKKKVIIKRSQEDIEKLYNNVIPIMKEVKKNGDAALIKFNKKFDKVDIPISKLRVKESEFAQAEALLSPQVKTAIRISYRNVNAYHRLSLKKRMVPFSEIAPGTFIGEHIIPIDSVGMYIPRGKGSFPSMVYMLAIPASLAEVPRRVLVTPPLPDGSVDPACLYAAKLCGVHEVYKVGGAHAIAALAYGTKKIKSVIKIIGPSSAFVSAAKRYVSTLIDVGLPAGPSESIIISDGSTPADLVAYDLCIEAEHGKDSMSILLTHKQDYAQQVVKHLNKIISEAPEPQKTIISTVFTKYPGVLLTENEEASISLSNQIAPEHLLIHSDSPNNILSQITNAGEILIGINTPFTIANYSTGANAVIPTGGMARTYSSVAIDHFTKKSSIIKMSQKGLQELLPHVRALANYEGFHFHEKALSVRQSYIDKIKE